MRRTILVTIVAAVAMVIALYFVGPWHNNDGPVGNSDSDESAAAVANLNDGIAEKAPVRVPDAEAPIGKDVTVRFRNGKEVQINLRQKPIPRPYFYPTERFLDLYDELELAAMSGHSAAAIQIFRSLKACQYAHRTKDELDRALERLRTDGIIEWPNGVREAETIPHGIEYGPFEQSMIDSYELCEGVSDEQANDAERWARLAAEAGDYMGIRLLTEEIGKTQESYELWQQAWEQGYVNGAQAMIIYYRDGIPESLGGEPDYIRMYAFQLIRNKLHEAASQWASHSNSNKLAAMDNALRGTGGFLTPQEQEEAEALAAEILSEDRNCCLGMWGWQQ